MYIKSKTAMKAIMTNDFARDVSTSGFNADQKNFYFYALGKVNEKFQNNEENIDEIEINTKDFIKEVYGNYNKYRFKLQRQEYINKENGKKVIYNGLLEDIINIMHIVVYNLKDNGEIKKAFHLISNIDDSDMKNNYLKITMDKIAINNFLSCFNEKGNLKNACKIMCNTAFSLKNTYAKSLYVIFCSYDGFAKKDKEHRVEFEIKKDDLFNLLLEKRKNENTKKFEFVGCYNENGRRSDFEKYVLKQGCEPFRPHEINKNNLCPIFLINKDEEKDKETEKYKKLSDKEKQKLYPLYTYDKKNKTYKFILYFSQFKNIKNKNIKEEETKVENKEVEENKDEKREITLKIKKEIFDLSGKNISEDKIYELINENPLNEDVYSVYIKYTIQKNKGVFLFKYFEKLVKSGYEEGDTKASDFEERIALYEKIAEEKEKKKNRNKNSYTPREEEGRGLNDSASFDHEGNIFTEWKK